MMPLADRDEAPKPFALYNAIWILIEKLIKSTNCKIMSERKLRFPFCAKNCANVNCDLLKDFALT